MKAATTLLVALVSLCTLRGQELTEKHIDFSGKDNLTLNIKIADSIRLQTWSRNEVYVTASVNINDNKDNEAYTISFDDNQKSVIISADFKKDYFRDKNNFCCDDTDIRWNILLPDNAEFSVGTINGNIIITGIISKLEARSVSGFIDLEVPADRSENVEFSTITGTIYSNHDLNQSGSLVSGKNVICRSLNTGGPLIKLETVSGDIFFRRSG